jgi:hypothetical protein
MENTYLILDEPIRQGSISINDKDKLKLLSQNEKENDYLLILFSFNLFEILLYQKKLNSREMLDPFINLIIKYLYEKHTEIGIICLRILIYLHPLKLPTYLKNTSQIIDGMFELINNVIIYIIYLIIINFFYNIILYYNINFKILKFY